MWTCKKCAVIINDDAKEFCFECMTPRETQIPKIKPMFSNNPTNEMAQSKTSFLNTAQGYILIALACVIIGLLAWNTFKSKPKYTYKVINVQAQFNKGTATDADLNTTSVNLKDEELSLLGNDGWELVGTFLEVETTHPNYGKSEYVTGLQPNIRPQKAVLLFKKQL